MPLLSYQKLAVSQIKKHKKGTIFIPTGGGKTYVFMTDAKNRIQESDSPLTIVVVAPRILLSEQLASEFQKFLKDEEISITHVHSGHKNGTTKPHVIATYDAAIKALCRQAQYRKHAHGQCDRHRYDLRHHDGRAAQHPLGRVKPDTQRLSHPDDLWDLGGARWFGRYGRRDGHGDFIRYHRRRYGALFEQVPPWNS